METKPENSHTHEIKSTHLLEAEPATSTSASMTTSELEEINNFFMYPHLYNAAKEGNIDTLKECGKPLDLLVTPTKSTILHTHLAAISSDETQSAATFVKEVLNICPSLLWKADINGDTPLHIVARMGYKDILEDALKYCDQDLEMGEGSALRTLLSMKNKEDTTLHEAVRNDQVDVAKVLIEKLPELQNLINGCGETPLYLAAEGGHLNFVQTILETCQPLAYEGPEGKTALHAATLLGDREKGLFWITIE